MALNSGKILMRRGQEVNFDPNKMMPGEWAVSLDSKFVRMCFSPGVCIRMATYEAFEADMVQIQRILAECQTIEEAVKRINDEVSVKAQAAAEYASQAKQYRDEAEQFRNEAFSSTPEGYAELVDTVHENTVKIDIITEKAELNIKETASGENIHLIDSADSKLVEFALYGKAVQDGTPTPQNPVDIEVAGSGGSVEVKSTGKNKLKNTATSQTINGVTFTVNEDKSIQIKGTPTLSSGSVVFNIFTKNDLEPNEKYIYTQGVNNELTVLVVLSKRKDALAVGEYTTKAIVDTTGTISSLSITEKEKEEYPYMCVQLGMKYDKTNVNETIYPMIRLASDTDPTYEPYKETLSTIPTTDFAGIKVDSNGNYTDSNGQQWIANEIVKYADGSGEKIQRVGKTVLNGSEGITWTVNDDGIRVVVYCTPNILWDKHDASKKYDTNILCNYLIGGLISSGTNRVYFDNNWLNMAFDSGYFTSSDEFNAWLTNNNLEFWYELAEPIHTPLTAEEIAEIEKLSTFYPVTNISNDFDCGMKVKYIVDSKNYIDNQLAIQAKLQEEALLNMLLLMPEEVQASMIEKDTNNLLNESEV